MIVCICNNIRSKEFEVNPHLALQKCGTQCGKCKEFAKEIAKKSGKKVDSFGLFCYNIYII